jgi:hypothetical protein
VHFIHTGFKETTDSALKLSEPDVDWSFVLKLMLQFIGHCVLVAVLQRSIFDSHGVDH